MAVITRESVQSATVTYSFEFSTARNGRGGNPMVVFRSNSPDKVREMSERTGKFLKARAAKAGKAIKLAVTFPRLDKYGAGWYTTVPVYNYNTFSVATTEALELKFAENGIVPINGQPRIEHVAVTINAKTELPSDEAILASEPEEFSGVPIAEPMPAEDVLAIQSLKILARVCDEIVAKRVMALPPAREIELPVVTTTIVDKSESSIAATVNSLRKFNVKELKARLASLGIKVKSKVNKPELLQMLAEAIG